MHFLPGGLTLAALTVQVANTVAFALSQHSTAPVAWHALLGKAAKQDGKHVVSQDSLGGLQSVQGLWSWHLLAAPQASMGMFLVLQYAKIVLLDGSLVTSQAAPVVSSVIKGSTACWAGLSAVE